MAEEEELVKAGYLRKKLKVKWKLCWYVLDLTDINNATFAHYEHRTMQRPQEDDEALHRLAQGRRGPYYATFGGVYPNPNFIFTGARQIIPLNKITSLRHEEGSAEFAIDLATGGEVLLRAKNAGE